jgi:hypothetical protein
MLGLVRLREGIAAYPQKPAAGSGGIASGIGLAAARQFIAVDFVTSAAIVTPFAPELA